MRITPLVLACFVAVACKTAPVAPEAPGSASPGSSQQSDKSARSGAESDLSDPSAKLDRAIQLALETVYFEFDSASLTPAAIENLIHMASALKQLPEARLSIEAHSDQRGSNEYNLALSQRRGEAIQKFLLEAGVSSKALEVKAFGEEIPAVDARSEEAYAKNRRGEFKRLN